MFDAFSGKDLQTAMTLLLHAKKNEVESVEMLLDKVVVAMEKHLPVSVKGCPECSGSLVGPYKIDGLRIFRCSEKCGYSEVIE